MIDKKFEEIKKFLANNQCEIVDYDYPEEGLGSIMSPFRAFPGLYEKVEQVVNEYLQKNPYYPSRRQYEMIIFNKSIYEKLINPQNPLFAEAKKEYAKAQKTIRQEKRDSGEYDEGDFGFKEYVKSKLCSVRVYIKEHSLEANERFEEVINTWVKELGQKWRNRQIEQTKE